MNRRTNHDTRFFNINPPVPDKCVSGTGLCPIPQRGSNGELSQKLFPIFITEYTMVSLKMPYLGRVLLFFLHNHVMQENTKLLKSDI